MATDHQMIKELFSELDNQLTSIEAILIDWESNLDDHSIVDQLFRFFHNVKGTSGMCELENLQEVSHISESLLEIIRQKNLKPTPNSVQLLLQSLDYIKDSISNSAESFVKPYRLLADLLDETNSINQIEDSEAKKTKTKQQSKDTILSSGDYIRLNQDKINELSEITSLFLFLQNGLKDTFSDTAKLNDFQNDFYNLSDRLQNFLLSIRLSPISPLVTNLKRVAKSAAAQLQKRIDFKIIGDDVGLDRKIIETIKDPLVHIIRNSVDHGIESMEDRENSNKPAHGLLTIETKQIAGHVIITISDDGKGFDKNKIKQKAIDKGYTTYDKAESLNENEIFEFIFLPGFSTKDEANTLSGRGVGMDSVKHAVESIGGSIEMSSKLGVGTKIKLNLPSSLAVIKALSFEIGRQFYAIAKDNIEEVLSRRLIEDDGKIITLDSGATILRTSRYIIPLINVAEFFGLEYHSEHSRIVIVKKGEERLALELGPMNEAIDFISNKMPKVFSNINFISGINQLNSGKYISLININAFFKITKHVKKYSSAIEHLQEEKKKTSSDFFRSKQKIVFFSFGDTKFALPIQAVKDVILINKDNVKQANDDTFFIELQDRVYSLIDLKKYFQTNSLQLDDQFKGLVCSCNNISLVIPCQEFYGVHPLPPEFQGDINATGVLGIITFLEQSFLALNIHEIFALEFPEKFDFLNQAKHKITILIVEDDHFFARTLTKYLETHKISTVVANNGKEALEYLDNNYQQVNYILTDYEMPIMNGVEFVENLKQNPKFQHLPVTMLTAVGDQQTKNEVMTLGAKDFVNKINYENALSHIARQLISQDKVGVKSEMINLPTEKTIDIISNRVLVFKLANDKYGLNIKHVKDFSFAPSTTKIPLMPKYLCKLIAFRGKPIPVIDLRRIVNTHKNATNIHQVVVDLGNEELCALWVDQVHHVIDIEDYTTSLNIETTNNKSILSSLTKDIIWKDEKQPITILNVNKIKTFIDVITKRFPKNYSTSAIEISDQVIEELEEDKTETAA